MLPIIKKKISISNFPANDYGQVLVMMMGMMSFLARLAGNFLSKRKF